MQTLTTKSSYVYASATSTVANEFHSTCPLVQISGFDEAMDNH